MQNAMDIMSMVQRTGMTRQKSDVPGKTFEREKGSFLKELKQARNDIQNNKLDSKAAEPTTQRTTESKAEKLAKVMSNISSKAEIRDKQPVMTDSEEELVLDDATQSAMEMLQYLMQMMKGLKTEDPSNPATKELLTQLEGAITKLEQALSLQTTGQTGNIVQVLSSINSDLTEIFKQLEAITKTQASLQQPETKDSKNEALQELSNEAVKIEKPESIKIVNEASKTENVEGNQQVVVSDNEKSNNSREKEDKGSQDHKETQTEVKLTNVVKPEFAGDKLNQNSVPQVVPHNESLNLQLNVKQVNSVLGKDSFVKINNADIINQVIKKADIILQGSHQEMIMKLEPESLGKLNLKLVVENGLITAKFVAESQQVKEVLESSFNQLKDALQEKGISVQSLSVSVGQQGAEFSSSQGFEQWKRSMKLGSKTVGDYMEMEEELSFNTNPYSYHEGKVDYRA